MQLKIMEGILDMNGAESQTSKRRVKIKVIRYGTVEVDETKSDSEIVFDLESIDYAQVENYLESDFDVEVIR